MAIDAPSNELPGLRALKNYRKGFGLEAFRPSKGGTLRPSPQRKRATQPPLKFVPFGVLHLSYPSARLPNETVTFAQPFRLRGVDEAQPAVEVLHVKEGARMRRHVLLILGSLVPGALSPMAR